MLKLTPEPTFWAQVDISIAGQSQPTQIEVEFKHLPRQALLDWGDAAREGQPYVDLLRPIVVNWRGVDTAFSAEGFEALLNGYPLAAKGMIEAFVRESSEAKAKN